MSVDNDEKYVHDNEHGNKKSNVKIWKPLMRQLFVCSGVFAMNFTTGMYTGCPNVMIPQIRREANSTEVVTDDMASWLTSVPGYAAAPWLIMLPIISNKYGRKIPFFFMGTCSITSLLLLYFSTNTNMILISEIFQGLLFGGNLTVLVVIVSEYSAPRYRGIMLTHKATGYFCGVWVTSAIGAYSYWKNITYVTFALTLFSLTAVLWPESPSWLAMKGRFEECASAHHWLRGHQEDAQNDLNSLIKAQKEYIRKCSEQNHHSSFNFKNFIERVTRIDRAFYSSLCLGLTCLSITACTGKFPCMLYSLTLIEKLTNSESTAYIGMLVIEAISICSMEIGCILSKRLKRRTLLLGSCTAGVICQFVLSLYLYLVSLSITSENNYVTLGLLTLCSIAISMGPLILVFGISGEITPLRYKSISLPILAIYCETLISTVLKVTPSMFKSVGVHGTFLFYAASTSFFALVVYKYLPETKDKTLQEIEAYFNGTNTDISTEVQTACVDPLLENRNLNRTLPLELVFCSTNIVSVHPYRAP